MVDTADQDFLRSIFLMEAWDTLASLEDGLTRLASGTEPAWDDLFVVSHRLKGAASLHGFPRVASLADTMERLGHSTHGASLIYQPAVSGRRSRSR
jgi:chemotaxis protein histidine kinase CheA